jgi:vacuolar-type H+-ATPase subunit C/Vma6
MYSQLLSRESWQALYAASDCDTLIEVLRDGVYRPYVTQIENQILTPRRVVFELKKRLTGAYVSLIPLAPVKLRVVLSEMLRLYEVDNLKATLRGIIIGETWDRVRHTLFPLGTFDTLSYETLMGANNLADAIEHLKGSVYYSALSNALVRYNQEKSLFALEVALDLDYWSRLWKDSQKLSAKDQVPARKLIGTLMDMNNLLWALRYRIYHQLSEEEIINYTLPFGYHVRDQEIRLIAAGGDIPTILGDLYPDLTNPGAMLTDPQRDLPLLENWIMKRSIGVCTQTFSGYPFHAGLPIAYLHLLAMEIEDLTVLVEAKSMQIPYDRFRKFLLFDHSSLEPAFQS